MRMLRVIVWMMLVSVIVLMGEALHCSIGGRKMSGSWNAQSRRSTQIGPWIYSGLGGENTGQGGIGGGNSSSNPLNNNADDDGPQRRNAIIAATSKQDSLRQVTGKSFRDKVFNGIFSTLAAMGVFATVLGFILAIETYITRDVAKKSDIELLRSDIELLRRDIVIVVLVNAIVVMLVGKINSVGATGLTMSKE